MSVGGLNLRVGGRRIQPQDRVQAGIGRYTRWHVEQGYQQVKEELGLDHFERRSWPGFHHHATLCFLAYGFLALERLRGTSTALDELVEEETASPFRT